MPKTLERYFPYILIVVIGFMVFANSLGNGFVLDDPSQVTNNPNVKSLQWQKLFLGSTFAGGANLEGVYYKPLMTSAYALIYGFWGDKPFGFHLVQLIFHLANSVLVYLIFRRFFPLKLSLFLALVFTVHTLNSESVVYISALQEPLFFFFGAWAFLVVQYWELGILNLVLFAVLIFLSLLSKETGVLFLGISVIYSFIFGQKDKKSYQLSILQSKKFILNFGLLKIVSVAALVFGVYLVLRYFAVGSPFSPEKPYPIMRIPLFWRIMTIPAELFYYLRNFFFPWDLAVAQHWVVTSLRIDNFYLPLLFDLGFFGAVGWILLRLKSSEFKIGLFFAVWLVLGLGLHLNLMPLDVTVADRWFYFSFVGLLGLIGLAVGEFTDDKSQSTKKLLSFIGILIICALVVRTVVRNSDWRDGLTLALRDVKYSRDSFPLENNLAFELIRVNRYDEARIHAEESVRLGPHWWLNWNNLGVVYRRMAMTDPTYVDKAADAFKKGVENTNTFYMPYENLAEFLLFYKSPKEASDFMVEASSKLTLNARLLFLLAISQYELGNNDSAYKLLGDARDLAAQDGLINAFYNALVDKQAIQFKKPEY